MTPSPRSSPQKRLYLAGALGVLVAIGLSTKIYRGPLDSWVQGHLGDVLVMPFLIGAARWCCPQRSPAVLSGAILGVAIVTELLQLWQPPALQTFRATLLGKLTLGASFDGWDFLHYGLGAWLGYAGLCWLDRLDCTTPGHPAKKTSP
ncbi:MAG: DUF2809 domain-containing protein [Oscillatoriales cyanobacterium]|nr:MAG: DUF2809 domain-containing protein [Oscillatoriales cyanobacterium]